MTDAATLRAAIDKAPWVEKLTLAKMAYYLAADLAFVRGQQAQVRMHLDGITSKSRKAEMWDAIKQIKSIAEDSDD